MELYSYQKNIVNKTIKLTSATLIQLPTGGGKTHIATEIIRILSDFWGEHKQILFIAPKIVLMEQTIKAFERAKLKPHKIHGQNKFNIDNRVLVSTIHTASRRIELKPDVIIIDEIHYGFNGQMFEKLKSNNPNARFIGLSATPYDQNGKKLKGFSYIDEVDVRYLMNNNFLVQRLRQYELVKQDLSKVRTIAGDYDKKQLSEVVCSKNTILEIIETTSEFILNSTKTIVFAVDIVHAEVLTQAYINAGFKAKALHSQLKKDEFDEPIEIDEEIEAFRRGQTKILVSVLMLTTGFDVPDTDCAVIARPTKSQNLYKQMVGRILRKADNKDEAILLDCGNVIKNLGMPLEPIKETKDYEFDTVMKCKECKSKNIKLSKIENKLNWMCSDCGYSQEVNSGSYKCDNCKELHDYTSNFIVENNQLKLNCNCGYKTIISEYSNEKLVEVIEDVNNQELKYLDFNSSKEFMKELKIKSIQEWKKYKKSKPDNIPENPHIEYRNDGWIDYIDWLNIEKKRKTNIKVSNYINFEEARDFARTLNLRTVSQWKKYCKNEFNDLPRLPDNIPTQPHEVYSRLGWKSYKNWLGTGFMSFNKAKEFVINLKLKNKQEWNKYCKNELSGYDIKPRDIPRDPELRYRDDWINWEDWLTGSTDKVYGEWLSFEEARDFVRALDLNGQVEWKRYCKNELSGYDKKPYNIPASPDVVYKKDWKGYGDWLGNIKIGIHNYKDDNIVDKKVFKSDETKMSIENVSLDEIADECNISVSEVINKAKEINIIFNSKYEKVSFDVADEIATYILK